MHWQRQDLLDEGYSKYFGKKFSQRTAASSDKQVVSFEGEDSYLKFDSLVKIVVLL